MLGFSRIFSLLLFSLAVPRVHARLQDEFSMWLSISEGVGRRPAVPARKENRERSFSLECRKKAKYIHTPQPSFSAVPYFGSEAITVVQPPILWLVSVCRWTGGNTCKESMTRSSQVHLHWTEQAIGIKGSGLLINRTEPFNSHNVLGVRPILWQE